MLRHASKTCLPFVCISCELSLAPPGHHPLSAALRNFKRYCHNRRPTHSSPSRLSSRGLRQNAIVLPHLGPTRAVRSHTSKASSTVEATASAKPEDAGVKKSKRKSSRRRPKRARPLIRRVATDGRPELTVTKKSMSSIKKRIRKSKPGRRTGSRQVTKVHILQTDAQDAQPSADTETRRLDEQAAMSVKEAMTATGAKAKKAKKAKNNESTSSSLDARSLGLHSIDLPKTPVPRLAHGLDRVLFKQGVYPLQDARSRVYNFDPYLEKIMPVKEFDFNTLGDFITPSRDNFLIREAKARSKRYVASTSSMTGALTAFHLLLSSFRELNFGMLSQQFKPESRRTTLLSRGPSAIFLRRRDDDVYAVDADKEFDSPNVLSLMGKFMEKLLTLDKELFEKHRVSTSHLLKEGESGAPEAYHYSTIGDIIIRSQLDAYDPRLPGSGIYDLKTRAVFPIRMDSEHFEPGMDYEIRTLLGQWESFEREYHDMARSVMVKYSLQVRMGRMDGIFVAFHNIARIFGFQYMPLEEMDSVIHGQKDPALGDTEMQFSLHLMNDIFNQATARFPNTSIRFHFDTRDNVETRMYVFAEPVTEDEVDKIQFKNSQKIMDWEAEVLGRTKSDPIPAALRDVECELTSEHLIDAGKIGDAKSMEIHENGHTKGSQNGSTRNLPDGQVDETAEMRKQILAFELQVQHVVNGTLQSRVSQLTADDDYELKYQLKEMPEQEKAWSLYEATKARRSKLFKDSGDDTKDSYYRNLLHHLCEKGRKYRQKLEKRIQSEEGAGVVRMWNDGDGHSSAEARTD